MINDKYYKTIKYVYDNKENFDWKEVNSDWVRELELPDYESGDLRDCYYFVSDKNNLGIAVGSYYSRFYHDSDEYSISKEYFMSFFISKKQGIKGVNLVTADEYLEYKRKEHSPILWAVIEEGDIIKEIYEYAQNSNYGMDSLLLGFIDEDEGEEV